MLTKAQPRSSASASRAVPDIMAKRSDQTASRVWTTAPRTGKSLVDTGEGPLEKPASPSPASCSANDDCMEIGTESVRGRVWRDAELPGVAVTLKNKIQNT